MGQKKAAATQKFEKQMKKGIDISILKNSILYSEELGICLNQKTDEELFKWFLASILFGARIPETIAKNTYKTFERYALLEPGGIMEAGWDFLVNPIMREGGYVRYDYKTSAKILRDCEKLMKEYNGSLNKLHAESRNSRDLENKLTQFYGVGHVTSNIFLRELRYIWEKSDPDPLPIIGEIAGECGIDLSKYSRKSIAFARIEAGLMRQRKLKQNP